MTQIMPFKILFAGLYQDILAMKNGQVFYALALKNYDNLDT